ncbi:hypothetical protein C0J52_13152 [Blattella germanica]|nr:hypothetical protein C0J52_13152 [Blattella germanica]
MIRINKQLKEENEKLKNQLRQKDQELEQLKQYPDKEGSSKDVPKDGPITVQTSPPILPPEISKPDRCCTTCCSNCTSACTCEKESPVSPKMTSPQAPQVSNEPCSICGTCSADPCPCNEEQAVSII